MKSRKPRSMKSRKSRKPRSMKSRKSRKPRSKKSRKSRNTRSKKSRKSRKPRSMKSRKSRKPRSKKSRKSRKPRSKKSRKSRKPRSMKSRKSRRYKNKDATNWLKYLSPYTYWNMIKKYYNNRKISKVLEKQKRQQELKEIVKNLEGNDNLIRRKKLTEQLKLLRPVLSPDFNSQEYLKLQKTKFRPKGRLYDLVKLNRKQKAGEQNVRKS
jgi:hypothetical protein